MGNCQAAEAEAAAVVIQHPCGRMERYYTSLSASDVMASNPGHYVAVIITTRTPYPSAAATSNAGGGAPVKHLKLLRPDDTLHMGHLYRLVSFEEVLREFVSKKHVRLSRLLVACKEKSDADENRAAVSADSSPPVTAAEEVERPSGGATMPPVRPGQWRPALQSIAEVAGN